MFGGNSQISLFENDEGLAPLLGERLPKHLEVTSAFDGDKLKDGLEPQVRYPEYRDGPLWQQVAQTPFGKSFARLDWAHETPNGELLLSGDGQIHSVEQWRQHQIEGMQTAPRLLADFTNQTFTLMKAPTSATQW